jgi:hypothetical protein
MVGTRTRSTRSAAAAAGIIGAGNVDVTRQTFKQVCTMVGSRRMCSHGTGSHKPMRPPPCNRPHAIDPMQVLPAVADALERCEFFALDCEMTGLFLDTNKSDYLDDVQDRWGWPGLLLISLGRLVGQQQSALNPCHTHCFPRLHRPTNRAAL